MTTVNVVISLTPYQKSKATKNPFQTLRKVLFHRPETLPPPAEEIPEEHTDEKATIRIGGSLKLAYHAHLKHLAETNGMPMTKVVIRLLQLPERP